MATFWMYVIAVAAVFSSLHTTGDALVCYVCTYTNTGTLTDSECINDPSYVQTGNTFQVCDQGELCTTNRIRDITTNAVLSMDRACRMANPSQEGCGLYQGDLRESCMKQCDIDLCNVHYGARQESDKSEESPRNEDSDYPDGFHPPPVSQDGWYKVWVNNGATLAMGNICYLCLTMLISFLIML